MKVIIDKLKKYIVNFDGACSVNPGPMSIGYVIKNDNNKIISKAGK